MKSITAKTLVLLLFAFLMTLSCVACAQNTSSTPTTATTSTAATSTAAASTSAATPSSDLAFQKYDPPITITAVKVVPDTVNYFPKGQDINNNMWVDLMRDQMGITIKYDWTASTQQQYDDKLNVNIAAGNIPDIIEVNKNQLARLANTNLINKDLGAVFEQYASPLIKEFNTAEGPANMASATFGGKLAAFPQCFGSMDWTNIMWLRQDWLDKLGLKAPATMDEFNALVDAFTTKDPDGTGAKDYIGLALSKEFYNMGELDFVAFANCYHAYPTIWVKDSATGKLVYGSYQPAMKAALLAAQKLYAAGKIDKEFAVKDSAKEAELIASGKCGIEFGQQWNPLSSLQPSVTNNPKADWVPYPLPSVDGTPATPQVQLGVSSYYVASAKFAHPEAIVKIQNMYAKMLRSSSPDEFKYIMYDDASGVHFQPFFYCLCRNWPVDKNLVNMRAVNAVQNGDTSKLNPEQLSIYNTMQAFKGGKISSWGMTAINKANGSYKVIGDYFDNHQLLLNAFYGSDTPTMSTKKSALDKLEIETFHEDHHGRPD